MATNTPLATIHQYVAAFNQGDTATMAATFASSGQILDGLPPHAWQGPDATLDWYRDVIAEGKSHGATNYVVTLGTPLHNDETSHHAYLVVPATMAFDLNGTRMNQSGAVFTVALQKTEHGWRISAWAWAKGTNKN